MNLSRKIAIDIVFIILLALYVLAGVSLIPFHADESTQIYMSRDYAYQFLQGDLDRVTYHDPLISAQEQDLRILNGSVNKYLIGLAWHLGGFTIDQINEQWDWGADYDYNVSNNHAPSQALLAVSRIPSALLLASGVLWIFLIGMQLGGRQTAYLASLFYALNSLLLINARRAIMEGSFIAFTLLTVLAAIWWVRASHNRRWLAALILGVASGLALASKHTAIFVVVPILGGCFVLALYRHARKEKRREGVHAFLSLLLVGILAALVFYMLNPVWWGDPLSRIGEVLNERQRLLEIQTSVFGSYPNTGASLSGFFRHVFIGLPQYFEVAGWENYIGDQIAVYEASLWKGVAIGGSTIGGLILLIFTISGFVRLFLKSAVSPGIRAIIFVWAVAAFVSTLLLTPLDWGRYYLPAIPAVGVLSAYGIAGLAQATLRIFRGRSG